LDRLACGSLRAVGRSGYARIDFRVTPQGQGDVLQANASPNLAAAEDFAESARAAGTPYGELLEHLMDLGLKYRAQWRASYGRERPGRPRPPPRARRRPAPDGRPPAARPLGRPEEAPPGRAHAAPPL